MSDFDAPEDSPPSRSQRRREALDVLKLAQDLVALDPPRLAQLDLDEDLAAHLANTRSVTQHIARKREVGFLAKQLRRHEAALPALRAALDADTAASRESIARLHRVEAWRDRLVREGDEALAELMGAHPTADRQQLRTLARRARDEHAAGQPPAASRLLFRALRELMV